MLSASCMLMHMEYWLTRCLMHGWSFVEMSLFHSMQYTGNIKHLSSGFYLILLMYLGSLIARIVLYSYKPLSYCNMHHFLMNLDMTPPAVRCHRVHLARWHQLLCRSIYRSFERGYLPHISPFCAWIARFIKSSYLFLSKYNITKPWCLLFYAFNIENEVSIGFRLSE